MLHARVHGSQWQVTDNVPHWNHVEEKWCLVHNRTARMGHEDDAEVGQKHHETKEGVDHNDLHTV